MPPLFDMHVHTTNSPDATLTESELARRASEAGLAGLGFVAHLDYHPSDACTGFFDGARYKAAVRDAQSQNPELMVLCGVEVGEPHLYGSKVKDTIRGMSFDYVTGALHWLDDQLVLGPDVFEKFSPLEVAERYYRTTLEMLETPHFDVLAHLGIFRRGMALAGLDTSFDETLLWPGLMQDVLGAVIARGIVLELNTSGLRRREKTTYPSLPVLKLYRSLGGRHATLGSDTHRDPWVFFGLDEGRILLLEAGFETCRYMSAGVLKSYPLQPQAITR
ncbi:MAG: PHP domain-containing protein [Candidatus Fermentibacteraceae bacterium]